MLPGFHEPRIVTIHVGDDGEGRLWHYHNSMNVKLWIETRSLTGVIEHFSVKESKNEKALKNQGLARLKGVLTVGVKNGQDYYRYNVNAGLDSVFFRTLLISLKAVQDLRSPITIDPWLSQEKRVLNCSLVNPKNQWVYQGERYGDNWDGLDYPELVQQTLARFNASQQCFDLIGMANPKAAANLKVVPKLELSPQHNALVKNARIAAGFSNGWVKEFFDINFHGRMPAELPLEAVTASFVTWAGLCDRSQDFPTPEAAQESYKAALAQADGRNASEVFVAWIEGWTVDDLPDPKSEEE